MSLLLRAISGAQTCRVTNLIPTSNIPTHTRMEPVLAPTDCNMSAELFF